MNTLSFSLRDRVILVSGSSRGIGREVARLALAAGARVVINGRNAEVLHQTERRLGISDRLLALAGDVSRPEVARDILDQTIQTWGRVDVVINNAGLSMRGSFADLSPATVQAMIEGNLLSATWLTQAALPALRRSQGAVVFISTLAAVRGFSGVSFYSATKMALTALHQSLDIEEANNKIRSRLVFLAFTENDVDKTVWGADGQRFRHQRKWTLTQEQTARKILQATLGRRRQVVLSGSGRALDWAQRWFPGLTSWIFRRAKGSTHAVRRPDS